MSHPVTRYWQVFVGATGGEVSDVAGDYWQVFVGATGGEVSDVAGDYWQVFVAATGGGVSDVSGDYWQVFVGATGGEVSDVASDYWQELEEGAALEGLTVEEYKKKVDLNWMCVCVWCVYVCAYIWFMGECVCTLCAWMCVCVCARAHVCFHIVCLCVSIEVYGESKWCAIADTGRNSYNRVCLYRTGEVEHYNRRDQQWTEQRLRT